MGYERGGVILSLEVLLEVTPRTWVASTQAVMAIKIVGQVTDGLQHSLVTLPGAWGETCE